MDTPRFTANLKKSGSIAGLIFWLPVLSGSIFAAFATDGSRETVAGVALAVVAISFIISQVRQLSTANQHLVIDKSGVLYRWWSEKPVPWSDVKSARIHIRHSTTTGKKQSTLILRVDASKNPQRGTLLRWLKSPFMAITTTEMDITTEQVVAAVRRFGPDIEFS